MTRHAFTALLGASRDHPRANGVERNAKRGGSSALGSKVPSSALLLACYAWSVGRGRLRETINGVLISSQRPETEGAGLVMWRSLSVMAGLAPWRFHLVPPQLFLHSHPPERKLFLPSFLSTVRFLCYAAGVCCDEAAVSLDGRERRASSARGGESLPQNNRRQHMTQAGTKARAVGSCQWPPRAVLGFLLTGKGITSQSLDARPI
jgi:hypothetical protein